MRTTLLNCKQTILLPWFPFKINLSFKSNEIPNYLQTDS